MLPFFENDFCLASNLSSNHHFNMQKHNLSSNSLHGEKTPVQSQNRKTRITFNEVLLVPFLMTMNRYLSTECRT